MKGQRVLIHPVVILSILKNCDGIEFYNQKNKKTIGCLLGYSKSKITNCTSSFKIPFDEESGNLWFLDHNFLEKMAGMYKKVNGRENVLGWFGVKKKPDSIDLEINKIFLGFTLRPIFIIFWTQKDVSGFFLEAFSEAKKATRRGNHFQTLPTGVGMLESEEIGVFQILRNSDWSESKKTSQIYKLWIQILFSLSRFLKKKFLKSSFNSAHSEIPFSLFLNIKVQVKKFSSIFLEKNFFRENLFFLYSSALLKTMVSIERFVNLAMKKGIKKN